MNKQIIEIIEKYISNEPYEIVDLDEAGFLFALSELITEEYDLDVNIFSDHELFKKIKNGTTPKICISILSELFTHPLPPPKKDSSVAFFRICQENTDKLTDRRGKNPYDLDIVEDGFYEYISFDKVEHSKLIESFIKKKCNGNRFSDFQSVTIEEVKRILNELCTCEVVNFLTDEIKLRKKSYAKDTPQLLIDFLGVDASYYSNVKNPLKPFSYPGYRDHGSSECFHFCDSVAIIGINERYFFFIEKEFNCEIEA